MSRSREVEIAIVGTGIAGVATAYYLCTEFNKRSVLLIDSRSPMSFTSAQSGDNYRNWWPHPTMVDFTNRSIDLMEAIARETGNVFNMTHRGYLLVTRRADVSDLDSDQVEIIADPSVIRESFPALASDIHNVIRILRGGEIDIRGASQMLPGLSVYTESPPTRFSHYGGYYSMTAENWPLIGSMGVDGAFMVAALSGFGSMAACVAGSDCATWICSGDLPSYARDLSMMRHSNSKLMDELRQSTNKGLL